jgi:hypothetical protein
VSVAGRRRAKIDGAFILAAELSEFKSSKILDPGSVGQ